MKFLTRYRFYFRVARVQEPSTGSREHDKSINEKSSTPRTRDDIRAEKNEGLAPLAVTGNLNTF